MFLVIRQHFEHYVRPWIALALFSVGPFTVIAICNTLIVVALFRRRRSICISNSSLSRIKEEQRFYQAAAMCKAASGLFLVCTAPLIIVMEIGRPYWNVPPGGNAAYEVRAQGRVDDSYPTFRSCQTGIDYDSNFLMNRTKCQAQTDMKTMCVLGQMNGYC